MGQQIGKATLHQQAKPFVNREFFWLSTRFSTCSEHFLQIPRLVLSTIGYEVSGRRSLSCPLLPGLCILYNCIVFHVSIAK